MTAGGKGETEPTKKLSQREHRGFIIIIQNKRMPHGSNIASSSQQTASARLLSFPFAVDFSVPFSLLIPLCFMRRVFGVQVGAARLSSGNPVKIHFDVSRTRVVLSSSAE